MPSAFKIIDTSTGATVATVDAEDMLLVNGLIVFFENTYSKVTSAIFPVTAGMLVVKSEKEK